MRLDELCYMMHVGCREYESHVSEGRELSAARMLDALQSVERELVAHRGRDPERVDRMLERYRRTRDLEFSQLSIDF